jgi:hypothetical protein
LWSSRSPPFSNLEQSDAAFVLRLLMRRDGRVVRKGLGRRHPPATEFRIANDPTLEISPT